MEPAHAHKFTLKQHQALTQSLTSQREETLWWNYTRYFAPKLQPMLELTFEHNLSTAT